MEAADIIDRFAKLYAACSTYHDVGVVNTEGDSAGNVVKFKTYFARPSKFRFQWTSHHPAFGAERSQTFNIVWSDGIRSRSYYRGDDPEAVEEEEESLELAIAGATGVSSGAAVNVPALLLVDIRADCRSLLELTDLVLVREEEIHGHWCYVVEGGYEIGRRDTELWIDKESFSLRRISERSEISVSQLQENDAELERMHREHGIALEYKLPPPTKPMKYTDITDYTEVVFDESISDDVFEYKPSDDPRM